MKMKQLRKILVCGNDLPIFTDLYTCDKRVNYLFSGNGDVDKVSLIDQLSNRIVTICTEELSTYDHKYLKALAELIRLLDNTLLD